METDIQSNGGVKPETMSAEFAESMFVGALIPGIQTLGPGMRIGLWVEVRFPPKTSPI